MLAEASVKSIPAPTAAIFDSSSIKIRPPIALSVASTSHNCSISLILEGQQINTLGLENQRRA